MAVSMIIPVIIVVVTGFIIGLIIAAVKMNKSTGGNVMIRNVFIYLVLFTTLMMTIGGSIAAFMAVADLVAPTPYHKTFEEFKQQDFHVKSIDMGKDNVPNLSEAEIKSRYEAEVEAYKNRQISRAKNNLIKSLGWIVIPLPIFIYYQRRLSDQEV